MIAEITAESLKSCHRPALSIQSTKPPNSLTHQSKLLYRLVPPRSRVFIPLLQKHNTRTQSLPPFPPQQHKLLPTLHHHPHTHRAPPNTHTPPLIIHGPSAPLPPNLRHNPTLPPRSGTIRRNFLNRLSPLHHLPHNPCPRRPRYHKSGHRRTADRTWRQDRLGIRTGLCDWE